MRPRTSVFSGAIAVVAVAASLAASAQAGAPKSHGPKVSPQLASLADSLPGNDDLNVIVLGSDPGRAAGKHGKVEKSLGLIGAVSATVSVDGLDALAADDNVSFVAPDSPMAPNGHGLKSPFSSSLSGTLGSSSSLDSSSLSTLYPGRDGAPNAWSAGLTGAGVGIAVIDSGVVPTTDFGSRLVQVQLSGQTGSLDDTVGHGTMVAGVAAGQSPDGHFIGIAPAATVYAIDVNRPDGVHSSDVITALKWVFDNAHQYNIRAVNLSLGETLPSSYTQSPLDLAVERLWAAGVFVAVSAGNLGTAAGAVDYAPANDPLAFAAGAFDTMGTSGPGDDTDATWSSAGVTIDGFAKPELLAPGRLIPSVLPSGTLLAAQAPAANWVAPGYAAASGTSFAAPQLAGAAAIVFQGHPGWSPDQVKWLLVAKQGAKVLGSKIGTLDLSTAYNFSGTPGLANQGVPALVCAPLSTCLGAGTIASSWNSNSWNSNSWNSSTWNSSTWNSNSWNVAGWDSSGWTSNSWNSLGWSSNSWNTTVWN